MILRRSMLVVTVVLFCALGCQKDPLHTPSCRDAEKDVCSAERVDLVPPDLLRPGEEASWMVEEDVHVSCVLSESGRLEKCRVGRATEALGTRIADVLGRRRYRPVLYRDEPISESYDLVVRLLPVGKRATEARSAAFWWATDQIVRCSDGDAGIVCLASGAAAADPSAVELAALEFRGVHALPASKCDGREGVSVVHLLEFEAWGDKGRGEARVYGPCAGEHVYFNVQRADAGWSFTATRRDGFIVD